MTGPDLVVPDAWLRCAEKRELLRVAAQSALDNSDCGRRPIPKARAWAKHWASQPALRVPLSSGKGSEKAQVVAPLRASEAA